MNRARNLKKKKGLKPYSDLIMYAEVWTLCFSKEVPLHFVKSFCEYWELVKADVKLGQVMVCLIVI